MKLDQARQRLKQRYLHGIPSKVLLLNQGLDSLNSGDPEGGEAIRRLSHQIAGSAASYGFAKLGAMARQTELAEPAELPGLAKEFVAEMQSIASESIASSRVLVIEDDPSVVDILEETIGRAGRKVFVATTLAEAKKMVAEQEWSVILLDLLLPDGDGRSLLADIRSSESLRLIPVIVLSAKTNVLVRHECVSYGIDCFLEKPLGLGEVAAAIESAIERSRTIHEQAYVDDLTGVDNRTGFRHGYERIYRLCQRNKQPLTLALLDLDHFKQLNDTYGHDVGDEALATVARVLQETLRNSDLFGRWGGEEFVVAMADTDENGALTALEKIAKVLKSLPSSSTYPKVVTFSAGVVEAGESESLDQALIRADALLYWAKQSGRDRILNQSGVCELPNPSILIVDDDTDLGHLLVELLGREYRVSYAPSGESALEQAKSTNFDLVLLDQQLPGQSGIEVAGQLRHMAEYETCPILFLTSVDSEEQLEAAFAAGANDYIVKPYSERELLARIGRYVRSSHQVPAMGGAGKEM